MSGERGFFSLDFWRKQIGGQSSTVSPRDSSDEEEAPPPPSTSRGDWARGGVGQRGKAKVKEVEDEVSWKDHMGMEHPKRGQHDDLTSEESDTSVEEETSTTTTTKSTKTTSTKTSKTGKTGRTNKSDDSRAGVEDYDPDVKKHLPHHHANKAKSTTSQATSKSKMTKEETTKTTTTVKSTKKEGQEDEKTGTKSTSKTGTKATTESRKSGTKSKESKQGLTEKLLNDEKLSTTTDESSDSLQDSGEQRVAVVTGANKGIGFAIVKALCSTAKYRGRVYLTGRCRERGMLAVKKLQMRGLNCCFHELDVNSCESISAFTKFIKKKHNRVDILINNASISEIPENPKAKKTTEDILRTNYFGVVNVCEALFPLLQPHARVVNVSSSDGYSHRIRSKILRQKISADTLTEDELHELVFRYLDDCKAKRENDIGWAKTAYANSKVAVSALSRVQQRKFDTNENTKGRGIIVNHVHPGYVDTDMTAHKGPLTPEEGAVAPVYAALIPPFAAGPKGAYIWHDTTMVDWVKGPLPYPGW